ncbi:MAG TPA: T9SS type A sorting domain-containing protein, partial [Bacteroides sp.]|nr:T9SS type A sorting domain-containing protein [Bacteroides sp.]
TEDHTIQAQFIKIVDIIAVSVPNATMKIGDVIPVTITVVDDGGFAYELLSGNIGGYPLYGFQRINATTYLANFDITEGGNSYRADENIPVSNLVISDGTVQSEPYDLPIIQNNDLLDAELPVVESMTAVAGDYRIGDEVVIDIRTDGTGYELMPASAINGIPVTASNVAFTGTGGNNYRLTYTVREGDPDVGPGELAVSLIFAEPSGNIGSPFSALSNPSDVTIDAHPPVVTRMEVPSDEVGVGGIVQVTITADGSGYEAMNGTVINGVPLSSSRVTFSQVSDGLYELSYVVDGADSEVAPGNLQVTMVMSDPAGNQSQPFTLLRSNTLEIYTDLPTAVLGGTPEVCEGEEAELTVYLSGRPPWSIDISDGSATTSFDNINASPYRVMVSPGETNTYRITTVRDVNGVTNSGSGDIQVIVHEKTYVEIINLASGYSVDADPVKLEANVPGGVFSGPGVFSATGYFDPGLADTVDSPHTIHYTYVNDNGCVSVASKRVFVLGAQGDIFLPGKFVCDDSESFEVSAFNVADVTGSFRLLNANDQVVPGLTDHGDNTATVDPALLHAGNYTIEYEYLDQVVLHLRETFTVESVPVPVITSPDVTTFCQNDAPVFLAANVPGALFSGRGVTGNEADGFLFDPGQARLGGNTVTCMAMTENGCSRSTEIDMTVQFAPEVQFTMSTGCISQEGGNVTFNNQTGGKILVKSWDWDFDDPGSGQNNQSSQIDPVHFYSEPGDRSITLTATTQEGCVATHVLDTVIRHNPVADFTWISDCYLDEAGSQFVNLTVPGNTKADTMIWTFWTSSGQVLDEIGTRSATDTVTYPFAGVDSFRVDLYAVNEGGCADMVTKDISLRPTVQLKDQGYEEKFNESQGMWTLHAEDQTSSWVWDVPDFEEYQQVEEDKAWFTQLPSGVAGYLERSWVQSPCFDFSGTEHPLIKLDFMRSFVPNYYGAVLQYQDVRGEGWKTVGENNSGIAWYTGNNILFQPGGSSVGWGLKVFQPDTAWVTAIHDLDTLAGQSGVTFRIAVVTNGRQGIGNQGFAFDNVMITERSKQPVLEYFTNSGDMTSALADNLVDSLASAYSGVLTDLQYHMDYPDLDPMNENNPYPAKTRSFYYGIQEIPFAILDGGVVSVNRYNFSDLKSAPDADNIRLLSLEIPSFEVDLTVDWLEDRCRATTMVTCNTDRYEEYIQLYLVVFESSVTAYTGGNGETQFRNVVLDMLPTPAGKLLGGGWEMGQADTLVNDWFYADYVEDLEDLAIAAFIQDRITGRILQSDVVYFDESTGTEVIQFSEQRTLHVYPNPTRNTFFVNLGHTTVLTGRLDLIDMNGRLVLTELVPPGYQIYQIDIGHLNRGIYILRWNESGKDTGFQKIGKTK